ncbi:MAG: hypothetical protein JWO47_1048 [Candidatus Saccharibacteria bacterium]|nr:hypothetical protein [Candidatus Saccharibacteria bacterium]
MDPLTTSDHPVTPGNLNIPELQALLQRIDTILPTSTERSVTSVELYLNDSAEERLMITGLRYPSGHLGQVHFDYRSAAASSLIDLDTEAATMQGFEMTPQAEASSAVRHSLDIATTSAWLDGLITRGSVKQSVDS